MIRCHAPHTDPTGVTNPRPSPAEPDALAEGTRPDGRGGESAGGGEPRVLVVDDDEDVRRVLEIGLHGRGLRVLSARCGSEAVLLYGRHRADIGVVLLDVQMAGMDGPETLAALRDLDPEVRAVMMTGHSERYADGELLRRGAVRVVEKPFRVRDLALLLRQVGGG